MKYFLQRRSFSEASHPLPVRSKVKTLVGFEASNCSLLEIYSIFVSRGNTFAEQRSIKTVQ